MTPLDLDPEMRGALLAFLEHTVIVLTVSWALIERFTSWTTKRELRDRVEELEVMCAHQRDVIDRYSRPLMASHTTTAPSAVIFGRPGDEDAFEPARPIGKGKKS